MKKAPEVLESLAVRRARVADADKVRYLVYKTPTDFVAVIAESALLAIKAAGVKSPHKIVRDLPTAEGSIAIAAKKLEVSQTSETVTIRQRQEATKDMLFAEIAPRQEAAEKLQTDFKRLTLGDLQRKGLNRARILSPELLSEIIDEYSKTSAMQPPPAEAVEPVVKPMPSPAVAAPTPEASVAASVELPVAPPAPPVSQEEKVMQLANEILPSAKDLPPEEAVKLSPGDVDKLLNE